jgi:hypothetical protein
MDTISILSSSGYASFSRTPAKLPRLRAGEQTGEGYHAITYVLWKQQKYLLYTKEKHEGRSKPRYVLVYQVLRKYPIRI